MRLVQSEKTTHKSAPFYPALDGLRAVAVLLVFFFHYTSDSIFGWGWIGVDLFFVLSGFLITGILYDSRQQKHNFRNFYVRRTLRIFPLYFFIWAIILITTPLLHWRWPRAGYLWPLYLGNLVVLSPRLAGQVTDLFYPYVLERARVPLQVGHFWSLCVEEQFYLIWPFVVLLVGRGRSLMRIACGVIIFASLLRLLLTLVVPYSLRSASLLLYENPFTRVDSLMWGALLALLVRGPNRLLRQHGRSMLVVAAGSLASFCLVWTLRGHDPGNLHATVPMLLGLPIIDIFSLLLIFELTNEEGPIAKVLSVAPARLLGKVSYGFYVFHYLFLQFFAAAVTHLLPLHVREQGWCRTAAVSACGCAFSILMASLSYKYLEKPFIRMKQYF